MSRIVSRRHWWISALALSLAALGGCGGGRSAPPSGASSIGSTAPCARAAPAGSSTLHVLVDGRSRLVIVHVPPHVRSGRRLPLVLNLHGSQSNAYQQERFSGMDAAADGSGFLVAYPQAAIPSGAGYDWNVPGVPLLGGATPPPNAPDDVAFLTKLVPDLAVRYCLDRRRVFATGVSGGGRMASQLGCAAAGTFAALAPVAGLRFPDPCPARRAVPILAFHGTADPIDPYDGHGQSYWTYSVPVAAARWAAHDGCRAHPRTVTAKGYTLTRYDGCTQGGDVALYALTGEGHEWPGGPTLPARLTALLGPQTQAVNANTTMWSFFIAHPLR